MKRIFTFCAAVAMLAACVKEAPKTPSANGITTPNEDGAPMAIQMKSNVVASVETKAQGSVDAFNKNQKLYIYGIERADEMDYTDLVRLVDNDTVIYPQAFPDKDGLVDLKYAVKDEDDNVVMKPYYYEGSKTYDFYGYYIDDLESDPKDETDRIYVPIQITGGEDILTAKANPQVDAAGKLDYRYAYSAYAARRDVQPKLTFQHKLVQFTFKVKSCYEPEEGDPDLIVDSLSITTRYKANLQVAPVGKLENIDGDTKELFLCELDDNGKLVKLDTLEVPKKSSQKNTRDLGQSLMVIPNDTYDPETGDSYDFTLYTTYDGVSTPVSGKIKFDDIAIKIPGQKQFTAGYSYEVTILVYGLERIELTVALTPWKKGGSIEIDTDEPPTIWDENGNEITGNDPTKPGASHKITDKSGNEITIYKSEGEEPAVGDIATPDGLYEMLDGTSILIEGGVITEIRPASYVITDKDGKEIIIYQAEGEALAVGVSASPNGTYVMADGSTIVITKGKIASITPAQGEEEEEEEIVPTPTPSYVITDKDGNEITIYQAEGEALAVGVSASPDGTYVMEDGSTIVITDGKIAEITPAQGEEEGGQNEPQN